MIEHHGIISAGMSKFAWLAGSGTAMTSSVVAFANDPGAAAPMSTPTIVGIGGAIVGIAVPLFQMHFKDRADKRSSELLGSTYKTDLDKANAVNAVKDEQILYLRAMVDRLSAPKPFSSPGEPCALTKS